MPTFALISEGITDQIVIEKIIRLFYKGTAGEEDFDVTHLQPTRDATDQARQNADDFGGWEQVLEHCSIARNLYEALAFNDYVVVHVDSDICWNESVDIDPGQSFDGLMAAVEEVVLQKIDPQIIASYRDRIIFAIAVHSVECWLLPFFTRIHNEKGRINSCEGLLSTILRRDSFSYSKDGPGYMELVKNIRRNKEVVTAAGYSPSLKRFISFLPAPV